MTDPDHHHNINLPVDVADDSVVSNSVAPLTCQSSCKGLAMLAWVDCGCDAHFQVVEDSPLPGPVYPREVLSAARRSLIVQAKVLPDLLDRVNRLITLLNPRGNLSYFLLFCEPLGNGKHDEVRLG